MLQAEMAKPAASKREPKRAGLRKRDGVMAGFLVEKEGEYAASKAE
jgi:hypothetical protein